MLRYDRITVMDSKDTAKGTLVAFWGYAKKYPKYLWIIAGLLPATLLIHQFLPQIVLATIFDTLSAGTSSDDLWKDFGWLLLLYAALRITSATILWRWVIIVLDKLEANISRDIANHVFAHLLSQAPHFHADRFSGTLVSQTTKFMSAYVRLAEAFVMQFLPLVLSFIFTAVILWPRAPHFVVVLFAFSLVYIFVTAKGTKSVRAKSADDAAAQSKQTGQLSDTLSNIIAVKSFAATKSETRRFAAITEQTWRKTTDYIQLHNSKQLYFSTLTSGMTSISVVLAVMSVVWFGANIGVAFLVLDYSANIIAKLWQFSSSTLRDVNRAFGESSDMVRLLQLQPTILDPKKPRRLRMKKGAIKFNSVSFTHPDANDALFNNFSVSIAPGEKIGLVGRSGAGKTTFVKLLMRFADTDSGTITIDSQPINEVTQDNLRSVIAYVPQEPALFHRSIKENIGYGNPKATDTQIIQAAKQAYADEFIRQLPDGYETLVGERGVKLSGGQRQRIAIARSLLKDAPVLVLDEATSALDSHSEALIQKSLRTLMVHRTAIVIAHRLSTIQKMDRIIVMDKGAIIEQGTHDELLGQSGAYSKLWKRQSGGFIDE